MPTVPSTQFAQKHRQGTESHKRVCLNGLTNSATIYWQTVGSQFNFRTFRTVSSLQEWLRLHSHEYG